MGGVEQCVKAASFGRKKLVYFLLVTSWIFISATNCTEIATDNGEDTISFIGTTLNNLDQTSISSNESNRNHSNGNYSNSNHSSSGYHQHGGVHVVGWQYDYVQNHLGLSLFVAVCTLLKLGFHHADKLSSIFPESCLLIVMGILVGLLVHFSGVGSEIFPHYMDPQLFFLILLPPAILESAFSLHDRTFYNNSGTVLIYAVVGTVLNFIIIGPLLYGLAATNVIMGEIDITFNQCLLFSALIVAVDPVAVLAIFQEISVNNTLYFLVFGESLLNDAVTIVLYNTMTAINDMDEVGVDQAFLAIAAFFTVSLGGICIGLVFGILTALVTKYTSHVRVVEPMIVFIFAYISYLVAELFHFSGIISIICCGLMQAQYTFSNISNKSQTTVKYFSKVLSNTSECIIFMFLGITLVGTRHNWHAGFTLWSILLCLFVRFIVVYGLSFLSNMFRVRKIKYEEQFIMAYGGLRGGVCFSLVAMLKADRMPLRDMFLTATFAVIIFTVFIQGTTIKPLVKLLRIRTREQNEVTIYEEINEHVTDHVMAGVEEIIGQYGDFMLKSRLEEWDDKYFKRWLQKHPRTKDEEIMEMFKRLSMQQHYATLNKGSYYTGEEFENSIESDEIKESSKWFNKLSTTQRKEWVQMTMDRDEKETEKTPTETSATDLKPEHLRKMFVGEHAQKLHMPSNRNLIGEDNTGLVNHLHKKRERALRYRRWSTSLSDSTESLPDRSPAHSLPATPTSNRFGDSNPFAQAKISQQKQSLATIESQKELQLPNEAKIDACDEPPIEEEISDTENVPEFSVSTPDASSMPVRSMESQGQSHMAKTKETQILMEDTDDVGVAFVDTHENLETQGTWL